MFLQDNTRRVLLILVGAILANLCALAILETPPSAHAAPTFTVNRNSDAIASAPLDNGICETSPGNGICTLRAAIMKANHYVGGGVTINVPAGAYTLTIPAGGANDETNGDLDITNTMTILGSGASTTVIEGNHTVINDRVIIVAGATVLISGVTVQDGGTSGNGGGIYNGGSMLTLTNSRVTGNSGTVGGGIFSNGVLTLTNTIVDGNNSTNGGAGIDNYPGASLMLLNSTVSGNSAGISGGGIANSSALTIVNSTINGNYAAGDAGGIWNTGTLLAINSTISGNNANGNAGGIWMISTSIANLYNVTVTDNQADYDSNGSGKGGGVQNSGGGAFNFQNSIIALNRETFPLGMFWIATPGDCNGTLNSNGYNIMYAITNCTVNGGGVTFADPILGPLGNNGGATRTHALFGGSPAINMGDNSAGGCKDNVAATITADQRGFHRPAGPRCDIGAYEYYSYTLSLPLILR